MDEALLRTLTPTARIEFKRASWGFELEEPKSQFEGSNAQAIPSRSVDKQELIRTMRRTRPVAGRPHHWHAATGSCAIAAGVVGPE